MQFIPSDLCLGLYVGDRWNPAVDFRQSGLHPRREQIIDVAIDIKVPESKSAGTYIKWAVEIGSGYQMPIDDGQGGMDVSVCMLQRLTISTAPDSNPVRRRQ